MTATDQYSATMEDGDPQTTHFEAFQYQDLADVAKTVKNAFDDLTGVSPLWFSVENDAEGGTRRHAFGGKRDGRDAGRGDGGGYEMFGDWRVEESLVDAFENEPQARSDKQEVLKTVNALLATYDDNGTKQRQGLEECVVAFANAIEGDLDGRLDELTEQCTQRWNEEQDKMEAAQTGLNEVEAETAARLEELGQVLKDRQDTVLAALKHEREANKRKILATTMSDPLEEGRTLFNRQVEETELEGRLKQRQRLLNLSSQGVQVQQEEVEAALLNAARDQVENLMKVVEKMQGQQTKLLVTLQAEKKNVSAMRQLVSSRLKASSERDKTTAPTQGGEAPTSMTKKGRITAMAVKAAVTIEKLAGRGDDTNGVGPDGQAWLSGTDLLDACDRLENDNLHLRQRLAKLELQTMQREHGDDGDDDNLAMDARLSAVVEAKRELESKLKGLQTANKERSRELKQIRGKAPAPSPTVTASIAAAEPPLMPKPTSSDKNRTDDFHANIETETKALTQKVKTLRRKLVFKLACRVMRRRFEDAGMGSGNSPDPPRGPIVVNGSQVEAAEDGSGFSREMQAHAALLRQKIALQREVERATRQERQLQCAIAKIAPSRDVPAVGQPLAGGGSRDIAADKVEGEGDGSTQSGEGAGGEDQTDPPARKRSSTRGDEENGDQAGAEGAGEGQPRLKKSKVTAGLREGAGERSSPLNSGATGPMVGSVPDRHASARLRALAKMQSETQTRLAVLRSLAVKNEEATQANVVDTVDNEAIEEVLRNEELARKKAVAVLDILRSRAMAKTRARWLKETLERSMGASTVAKSGIEAGSRGAGLTTSPPKEASQATPVVPAASVASATPATGTLGANCGENEDPSAHREGHQPSPLPVGDAPRQQLQQQGAATAAEVGCNDDDVIDTATGSDPGATVSPACVLLGGEEGAQLFDEMALNPGAESRGRLASSATGDGSKARNPEGNISGVDTHRREGSADQEGVRLKDETSESSIELAVKAEEIPVVEEGLPSVTAAVAETTAYCRQNEGEQAKASESEVCARLVQARAAKMQQIKDLREKVKAAGGGKPRSMSKELEEHEFRMAAKKAKEARRREKQDRITTAEGRNKETFKSLPPKTKREISILRKQESSLIARYELCVERMKKVLLSRGFSPTVTEDLKDSADHASEVPKQRKWTASERKKESFLHSLTPQLERWRARIVATTIVLEEEKARRDREMAILAATGDDEVDPSAPQEAASRSNVIRGSSADGRPGEWSEMPSQTPLLHAPHASNAGADHPLFAVDNQWRRTAASAGQYGPEYQDNRTRGSCGKDGVRYPQSSHDTTVGEVEDRGWQGVSGFTERAKEAARKRVAKVAAANMHGSRKYLGMTTRPSGGSPEASAFTSAGAFPSPGPPPGAPLPSSPSPRSPNVPPAARYDLERREVQYPVFSAAAGITAEGAAGGRIGRPQDLAFSSPAPSTHMPRTILASQEVLKDCSSVGPCPTNTKSSVSVQSWDDGLDSTTVTLPGGAGGGGFVSQSSLLSQDVSLRYEQQCRQMGNSFATSAGMTPLAPVDVLHRPLVSSLAPGRCYATEQERRQLLEQQLLQPARLTAGRGSTVASDRDGRSVMQRLGDAATSSFSLTAPLSPSVRRPAQQQRLQKQHLSLIKSQMEHPQRQPNWRVLNSTAEGTPSPPAYQRRGRDDGSALLRSASPRVQRSLELRQQQPDAVSVPFSKPSLVRPSSCSPSLLDPLSLMADASAALAASSPRSEPFSPPRGIIMAGRSKPPPIAIEGVSIVVEAGRDARDGQPQSRILRETEATNVTVAPAPSLPVGKARMDDGATDLGKNVHHQETAESEPNSIPKTGGDVPSRAMTVSTQKNQHQVRKDVQNIVQEGPPARPSWGRSKALELENDEINSSLVNAGEGRGTLSAGRSLGLVVQQEKIQPRPPWRQAPSVRLLASCPNGNPSSSGRVSAPAGPPGETDRSSNADPSSEGNFLPPEENVVKASAASPSPRRGITLIPESNARVVSTNSTYEAALGAPSLLPSGVAESIALADSPPIGDQLACFEDVGGSGSRFISNDVSSSRVSLQFIPIPTAVAEAPPQPSNAKRNVMVVGATALDATTPGAPPSSCRETGKAQDHPSDLRREQDHRQHGQRNPSSSAGDGTTAVGSAAASLNEAAPTKSVSFQPALRAEEWMDTEWRPSFALPCGGTRRVITVVSSNNSNNNRSSNSRPSTMSAELQPIFTHPLFSVGEAAPLRMVGNKITGEVAGDASLESTAAAVCHSSTSPSPGRSRGRTSREPRFGGGRRGGQGGRGGGAEAGEGAEHKQTGRASPLSPMPTSSPAGQTSGNASETPPSSLLTTTKATGEKVSSTKRAAPKHFESGPGLMERQERTRKEAVSTWRRGGGDREGQAEVHEQSMDAQDESETFIRSPPPSPAAWTPTTRERPLFSAGVASE